MFNIAPRYLSGVSVFLGDDITRRKTDGELVVFIGPAAKGPNTPVNIQTIDNMVPLYGSNNPLVKAAYQFWDGYADAGANIPLKFVAFRVGGIPAKLITSYGLEIETSDAYDGIENDFYVYIDDSSEASFNVKVWDKQRLLVYDYKNNVDTQHVKVKVPALKGTSNKQYGVDIDNDPTANPVSLYSVMDQDLTLTDSALTAGDHTNTVAIVGSSATAFSAWPNVGRVKVSGKLGSNVKSTVVGYTKVDDQNLTLDSAIGLDLTGYTVDDIQLIGSTLILGDSELGLTKRELYEKFRNALLEVETYTPDYLVPGGVYFDDADEFLKLNTASTKFVAGTTLTAGDSVSGTGSLDVEGAATWGTSGYIKIDNGLMLPVGEGAAQTEVVDYQRYNGITVLPGAGTDDDYRLTLVEEQFEVAQAFTAGTDTTVYIKQTSGGPVIENLLPEGFIKIGSDTEVAYYRLVSVDSETGVAECRVHVPADFGANKDTHVGFTTAHTAGAIVTRVLGEASDTTANVYGFWTSIEKRELGIGYVKETDLGDRYAFEWSDVKKADFGLATFPQLFANFCNEATVGYNTPLCAMNVNPPASTTRADVTAWIGSKPVYKLVAGNSEAVENVLASGTGLLGNPLMSGSKTYNRSYMNNATDGEYVDPAYGLLMTNDGFADGGEVRDTFGKVVDLGKFMCVGGALLTFKHAASGFPYNETCGIYALGMLAGSNKAEGISFKRIGVNSSTSVDVIVNRKLYNELVGMGYVVVTREKGLGWVINNDHSVARKDSGYRLISTTRIIKTVIEDKREKLASFIGKPINTFYYEAARTKLSEAFKQDVSAGLLNGYKFNLEVSRAQQAIGKLYLRVALNTPLELTQADIDTVIDRSITTA